MRATPRPRRRLPGSVIDHSNRSRYGTSKEEARAAARVTRPALGAGLVVGGRVVAHPVRTNPAAIIWRHHTVRPQPQRLRLLSNRTLVMSKR